MSLRIILLASAAVLVSAATACSSGTASSGTGGAGGGSNAAQAVTISVQDGVLVGPDGHTLYENTLDTASRITCTGSCAAAWPPVIGSASVSGALGAGKFGTTIRPDGTKQVTYAGHPLYEFAEDMASGDMRGSGMSDGGGKWQEAAVSGQAVKAGTTSPGGYGGYGGYGGGH